MANFKAKLIFIEEHLEKQHERLGRYLTQMYSLLLDVRHKIANLTGDNCKVSL